jgi:hypothetical protein
MMPSHSHAIQSKPLASSTIPDRAQTVSGDVLNKNDLVLVTIAEAQIISHGFGRNSADRSTIGDR